MQWLSALVDTPELTDFSYILVVYIQCIAKDQFHHQIAFWLTLEFLKL